MTRPIFVNRYFHPDHSATSQMLSELAFALAREGVPVHVVTSRQRYDDPAARLPAFESVDGVTVHRVWSTRFGRARLLGRAVDYLTFYPSAALTLLLVARRGDLLVAKTDPPLVSIAVAAVAAVRGAGLCNWLQDVFPEVARALGLRTIAPLAPLLASLRDWSLRRASLNVVLGERMAEVIAARGIPRTRIRVIPNWADGNNIRPLPRAANPLRPDWGLGDAFVVGYSGNLGRAHEFDTLLAAMERLDGQEDIRFVLIGGGAQRRAVEGIARDRGLRNVQFRPYQPRTALAASLSLPDVHVVSLQPALEGLIVPSKLYGILAAGRAVLNIGDPDGEIARLVARERVGRTIAPGDAAALAGAIAELAADPAAAAAMGERARAAFDRAYDQRYAVRAWRDVLRAAGV